MDTCVALPYLPKKTTADMICWDGSHDSKKYEKNARFSRYRRRMEYKKQVRFI